MYKYIVTEQRPTYFNRYFAVHIVVCISYYLWAFNGFLWFPISKFPHRVVVTFLVRSQKDVQVAAFVLLQNKINLSEKKYQWSDHYINKTKGS